MGKLTNTFVFLYQSVIYSTGFFVLIYPLILFYKFKHGITYAKNT